MAKRLMDAGADQSKPDADGNTPMHAAVGAGAESVIKLLGEKGISLDARNVEGFTPLVSCSSISLHWVV